jgi:hypothetical protein
MPLYASAAGVFSMKRRRMKALQVAKEVPKYKMVRKVHVLKDTMKPTTCIMCEA